MDKVDSSEHINKQNSCNELFTTSMTNSAHQRSLSQQHKNLYQKFLTCPQDLGEKNASSRGSKSSISDKFDQKIQIRHEGQAVGQYQQSSKENQSQDERESLLSLSRVSQVDEQNQTKDLHSITGLALSPDKTK